MMLKKIVIIGPESTGKSTLCRQLAAHYKAAWVPEYARQYLLENGTDYDFNDLLQIAKGQIKAEEEAIKENHKAQPPVLFIDTDLYVMKVWSEIVFNKCDNSILNQIVLRQYDLYLLCNTDLPWVKDELREYPDLKTREKIYEHYRDIMINQSTPWVEISGNNEERLNLAIKAVDSILGNKQ